MLCTLTKQFSLCNEIFLLRLLICTFVDDSQYKRFVDIYKMRYVFIQFTMSIDSSSTEDDDSEYFNHDSAQLSWLPRDILRRKDWLYRVDALRIHNMHEMNNLWEISTLFEIYVNHFISWAYSIKAFMSISTDNIVISKLKNILIILTKIIEMFWSEGYCYFWTFSGLHTIQLPIV